jgi:hypothetical protein
VQVPIAELSPFNGFNPFMTATIGEKRWVVTQQ